MASTSNASTSEVDAQVHSTTRVHWTDAENVLLVDHVINALTKPELATLESRHELPTDVRRLRQIFEGIEKLVPAHNRVDDVSSDTDSDAGAGGAAVPPAPGPPAPLKPVDQETQGFINRMEARIQAFPAPPTAPPCPADSGVFMRSAGHVLPRPLPPSLTAHACTTRARGESMLTLCAGAPRRPVTRSVSASRESAAHLNAKRQARKMTLRWVADADVHRRPPHVPGYKLQRQSEYMLAMREVLAQGLLLPDADEGIGFTSLRRAFEDSGEFKDIYRQSGYTSFETLWQHLRDYLGAYLGEPKSVPLRDKPGTMHGAAQLRGDEPVVFPDCCKAIPDCARVYAADYRHGKGFFWDIPKLHPYVVFTDNQTVDVRAVPVIHVICFKGITPKLREDPRLKKKVNACPVLKAYLTVGQHIDGFLDFFCSGVTVRTCTVASSASCRLRFR
jgi:hypothetical protein